MGRELRILLVEDNLDDALLIEHTLRSSGYIPRILRVDTPEGMTAALRDQEWDCILSDYVLPHFSGLEALALLQHSGIDLPFIILSGTIGEETAVEAMKAGAHDYLMKDHPTRLVPAIERELRESSMRRQRHSIMEMLRASEERYRTIFELAGDAFLTLLADDGSVVDANEAALRLLGYAREELFSLNGNIIVAPEAEYRTVQDWISQYEKNERFFVESVWIRKNGSRFPVAVSGRPFELKGEQHFQLIARDITEQKRSQRLQLAIYRIAQAADEAASLDELYNSVHDIVGSVMPAKNFYIALYDEKENLIRLPYFVDEADEPFPPYTPDKGLTEYVLRTGKALLCDAARDEELRRSGDVKLVGAPSSIWLGVPLILEKKTIGAMVVQHYSDPHAYGEEERQMLEFVSSQVAKAIVQKRAEDAVHASEETLRIIFNSVYDAILLHDEHGAIININDKMVELYGVSHEEVKEMSVAGDLSSPSNCLDELEGIWQRVLNDEPKFFEWKARRPHDGSEFDVEVFLRKVTILGRKLILANIRDITERKRAEQERLTLHEQLRQAQKLESIGTLAGGVAHDFNNILGIIVGYVSLIERGSLDPAMFSKSIESIYTAIQRGASLVHQLLTFARKSDVQFGSVNVDTVVQELLRMLEATFPKTIIFTAAFEEGLPPVTADTSQLHQALLNLCVNARDAMPAGGTLAIRASTVPGALLAGHYSPVSPTHTYVRISVSDSGTGMDAQTKSRIFEPFFTTKEKGKGTGIGLAVVHGVVNTHRGFIEVESAVGKGTTFHLYFPAYSGDVLLPRTEETRTDAGHRGTEKILLVEDENMLRDLVSSLLESNGYTIISGRDGDEAVELYRKHAAEIALVISDLGLPKQSGLDAYLEMKKINPGVRMIFASGYIDQQAKAILRRNGATQFLQKPYVPHQVLSIIRQVLEKPTPG